MRKQTPRPTVEACDGGKAGLGAASLLHLKRYQSLFTPAACLRTQEELHRWANPRQGPLFSRP